MSDDPPRTIAQPGRPATRRCLAAHVMVTPIHTTLPSGRRLLDALHDLLVGGLESASLNLSGGALSPFAYVVPAASPDATHAAYYSETRRPRGEARLATGAVTVGFRNGQPFFHCHALWTDARGKQGCGHVLPEATMIAAPIAVHGAGISGARFAALPDEETGFTLFVPQSTATGARGPDAVAVRLAPNQDLITALAQAGADAGFERARLAGGVGSTIGARFTPGTPMLTGYATELYVRHGLIDCTGAGHSELDITIVDLNGVIREGRLTPHDNPVLMTFEGVLMRE